MGSTEMLTALVRRISDDIVGERCSKFRFVEGGTLILYFSQADLCEWSNPRIWIDCAWRLLIENLIRIGSLDEPEQVLSGLEELKGQTLKTVFVDAVSGDLRLSFHDGAVIETFGYSIANEHWEYRRSDGLRLGVGPRHEAFERFESPQ